MSSQTSPANPHASPAAHESSQCHEALGFLDQSYDLIDGLLREVAGQDHAQQPATHADAVELALIGQPDGLASIGHLFL
ncbi:hypothetical protein J8I87_38080 [Paraburkholderia sp. LEh10]|uniref:hypothetical protein n=1 Tax=Paraburkholderia sp. LEh10 TaxID=2821353 RepID=UPI001AE97437|nr:hypothetical protein [Paraburkholderia sp. LEh10]MBP0595358.1 hypothetical protein [Paraburkholderia sp. LEh10]